jgi:branched-chain amino acid transport system substrate-binding protein
MTMRQAATVLAALVAVAVIGGACGSNGDEAAATPTPEPTPIVIEPIRVEPGEPIVIAVSAAFSGDQAELGDDLANAAEMSAAEFGEVAGREVMVIREDDGCADPERAVDVARRAVERPDIAGVIGPMCATGAQAAHVIYERRGVVHISPSATRSELSEEEARFFFRTAWRDDLQAATQARFAHALNAETVVVIDDGQPYGRALADAFQAAFEGQGGERVTRERIERGTMEFATLANRIVSAEPDVVVYQGRNPEGALIVRRLRESGYEGAFIAPDGVLSVTDFIEGAGEAAANSFLTGGPTPDDLFILRFFARYDRAPATPFVLQSYDAVTALLTALDALAEDDGGALSVDRDALAERLRDQRLEGLTGVIDFDERGDRSGSSASDLGLVIYRVEQGRFVPLD